MPLIGYARMSTEDQLAAGCTEILEEHTSGGESGRPVLTQTLARLRRRS